MLRLPLGRLAGLEVGDGIVAVERKLGAELGEHGRLARRLRTHEIVLEHESRQRRKAQQQQHFVPGRSPHHTFVCLRKLTIASC